MNMKKMIANQDGLTLVELIFSMVLITIISLAAFSGLQYAYYIFATSQDFIEETYNTQESFERDLTSTGLYGAVALDIPSNLTGEQPYTIDFEWDSSSVYSGTYTVKGYKVLMNVESEYLGQEFNMFLTEVVNPVSGP